MPKMKFNEDKYVDGVIAFPKGEVHEVSPASVERWLKRGGILVEGIAAPPTMEEKKAGIKHEEVLENPIEIEPEEESDDDTKETKRGRGRPPKNK